MVNQQLYFVHDMKLVMYVDVTAARSTYERTSEAYTPDDGSPQNSSLHSLNSTSGSTTLNAVTTLGTVYALQWSAVCV